MKQKSTLLKYLVLLFAMGGFSGCDRISEKVADALTGASRFAGMDGNSMYHQSEAVRLSAGELIVEGEVKSPGKVSLRRQFRREVMVKEQVADPAGNVEFIGAYRYRGYSLFDLLHPFEYEKKNAEEFPPGTDLYIVIENDRGESVVFSWAEIFHVTTPHQVIVATEMAPVEPYKQEVSYPMGDTWRIVAAGDLFACRTLDNPTRITVRSFDEKDYVIDRDLEPMYSGSVSVLLDGDSLTNIVPGSEAADQRSYSTAFYGMGMGYRDKPAFEGPVLADLLKESVNLQDPSLNRHGLVAFVGADGYRAVLSFSELFNRFDQVAPILSVHDDPDDGGHYRFFYPPAFYADYTVKSLAEMYLFKMR